MASRKGSLLERNVEQLLRLSGFNPQLNKICNGYEIDVFLTYKNLKIAFECKQYERSTLAIRNLIHQWDSKNKELNFDKIVLVLLGCDISSKDYQLAKKYHIIIWDEQKLTALLDKAIEKKIENTGLILKELEIKTDEINSVEKEETKQQIIIKEALNKMLNRGSKDSGFIIFKEIRTNFFVQYSFHKKGFMLFFPTSTLYSEKYLDKVKELLESLQFEDITGKDVMKLNEKEFVFEKEDLVFKEKEFAKYEIYAQCGNDSDFVTYLTDKIFRDSFELNDDYKIKVQLELKG